jgi:Spy/CpxP family protein refolding chaperone
VKSNGFLTLILSGAVACSVASFAQTSNSVSSANDTGNATTSQTPNNERGQKFAQELNLTPDQQADLKSIRDNMRQQAQAIKNDSSLTADQKKDKLKELRKSSHQQMMAKLTPDQQKKFKEMRKEHRGHRHGRKGEGDTTQG